MLNCNRSDCQRQLFSHGPFPLTVLTFSRDKALLELLAIRVDALSNGLQHLHTPFQLFDIRDVLREVLHLLLRFIHSLYDLIGSPSQCAVACNRHLIALLQEIPFFRLRLHLCFQIPLEVIVEGAQFSCGRLVLSADGGCRRCSCAGRWRVARYWWLGLWLCHAYCDQYSFVVCCAKN